MPEFSAIPAGFNFFLHQIPQLKLRAIFGRRFVTSKPYCHELGLPASDKAIPV
jgi:hypothetical protein